MNSFLIPSNMHLPKMKKGKSESGFAGKERKKKAIIHMNPFFSLTVTDDGKGIPEDLDLENTEHSACNWWASL
jgi:hypothetical protein